MPTYPGLIQESLLINTFRSKRMFSNFQFQVSNIGLTNWKWLAIHIRWFAEELGSFFFLTRLKEAYSAFFSPNRGSIWGC